MTNKYSLTKLIERKWELMLLVLSNTWLFAPYFNHRLSRVSTLISEYEAVGRPFSTLFRLADLAAAVVTALCGLLIFKRKLLPRPLMYCLLIVGVGMAIDSLAPITCRGTALYCLKDHSILALIHRVESTLTALALFYGSYRLYIFRRSLASMFFIVAQVAYGSLLFALTFVYHAPLSTLAQFAYQLIVSLGLVMIIKSGLGTSPRRPKRRIRQQTSVLVGILAVLVISTNTLQARLLHIRRIAPYFRGHPVWLSSYGAAIGIGLVFLAFKLSKGEARSRILTLILLFLNSLYFAVIRPQPLILLLSLGLFLVLYFAEQEFDRNTQVPKIAERLKQVGASIFLTATVLISVLIIGAVFQVNKKPRIRDPNDTVTVGRVEILQVTLPKSILTTFVVTSVGLLAWGIFRPAKPLIESISLRNAERALRKYGRLSEDFFKLWPIGQKHYFWADGGFICYSVTGSVAFALADPVCPPAAKEQLLQRFMRFCRSSGWTVCFLLVSASSLELYSSAGLKNIAIGSTALITIEEFTAVTLHAKWWRWQMNRAKRLGYVYRCSLPEHHDPDLIIRCKTVSDEWLNRAGHRERGFAMGYFKEQYLQKCILHCLEDKTGRLVAFTNQIPSYAGTTASIDLMRFMSDAEGAMPILLAEVLKSFSRTGDYKLFDLGLVPFAGLSSRSSKISQALLGSRFSASGLAQFKNKFDPEWQKIYLAYDGRALDLPIIARNLERVMDIRESKVLIEKDS